MDRRATLTTIFQQQERTLEALPVNGGLSPYTGSWNYATAAHLLRRACFGPSHAQIKQAVQDGLTKTMAKLLAVQPEPLPPVNYNFANDPAVPIGSSWVTAALDGSVQGLAQYRQNSLYGWSLEQMMNEGVSLTEKMTLFLHNHFVTSDIYDARLLYYYIKLLRKFAFGDFKELTKQITIDGAMLIYLNGNQNTRIAPNENYARELLELFTLGKGDLAGPGDYTTYTEEDILAIAKVLTGWTIRIDRMTGSYSVMFIPGNHDNTTKALSNRFPDRTIANAGNQEYKNLIDIIFKKREAATFICRKLYRYFIYYKVDAAIETAIVEEMADTFIANNYTFGPVVQQLLSSDHFYSEEALGCMIRPPYEFVFNGLKCLKAPIPTDLTQRYSLFVGFWRNISGLQQASFELPSVAGWPAYYQDPAYYQIWINSVTLPLRVTLMENLVNKNFVVRGQGATVRLGFELVDYIATLDNPSDVDKLLNEIVRHLLPETIYQNQIDFLKSKLLGVTTATKWTTDYNAYIANPTPAAKTSLENRLKPLFIALLSMPEYYLS